MLKKFVYVKEYSTGLRVESIFGIINIGLNKEITHKNLKKLPNQIIDIIKEYGDDENFSKMIISTHLLIDRDLIENHSKDTKKISFKKNKTNFIDKKYIKAINKARRLKIIAAKNIKIKTIEISTFKKYLFFSIMKFFLFLRHLNKFKYYSVKEIKEIKNSPYLFEQISKIEKIEKNIKKHFFYHLLSINYSINKITFTIPNHNFMGDIRIVFSNSR